MGDCSLWSKTSWKNDTNFTRIRTRTSQRLFLLLQENLLSDESLFQLLRQYGIFLNSPPMKIAKPPHQGEIETTLRDLKNQSCQIAFVVLNDVQSDVYDCVKQCGNQKFGLVTQCVSFQSLQKNSGKLRMCKHFFSSSLFFRLEYFSFQMFKTSVRRSTPKLEASMD